MEMCWGDAGLLLSMPRQGLGNAAIASVADEEQLARYKGKWAAMAITEPDTGSDSGAIRTTAVRDGDHYVLNGEKIFVTVGRAGGLRGRVGDSGPFARERPRSSRSWSTGTRRASSWCGWSTSWASARRTRRTSAWTTCRVPAANLLGSPEILPDKGFAGVMQTFDNTRPLVAAMAVGIARAALEETRRLLSEAGVEIDYDRPPSTQPAAAAAFLEMEADYESMYLLTLQAAWMADNGKPNSLQASYAKAKAGRSATRSPCAAWNCAAASATPRHELLEKWSRDAKIMDIFEGTQQIQQLIIARRLLGKTSAELK